MNMFPCILLSQSLNGKKVVIYDAWKIAIVWSPVVISGFLSIEN